MTTRLQNGLHRTVCWVFAQIVRAWPSDSRDWALAMQAELSEINNPHESLSWLAGGVMSLGKAWLNEVVYGSKDSEPEPAKMKTPGPLAFALAIAALAAFILMPSVHEGVSAVAGSWHPFTVAHLAEFQQMAREAEANHDAKTLAFLSTRMNSLDESIRLTDEAVEMDPSLKWLYIRGGSFWYSQETVVDRRAWMQKLVASDPDNAVVYLREASFRENLILSENNYQASKDKILNDPEWRDAMEKASPRRATIPITAKLSGFRNPCSRRTTCASRKTLQWVCANTIPPVCSSRNCIPITCSTRPDKLSRKVTLQLR